MPDRDFRPTGRPEDALRFREEGVMFPYSVIAPEAATHLVAELTALTRPDGSLPPMLRAKPHLLVPQLWDLVTGPQVVAHVTPLLGPDVLCFGTSLIWKPAVSDLHVSWHQDATHWGLTRPDAVTAWLALTPSTRASGCVMVVPGTNQAAVAHDHPEDPDNMLGRQEVARTEIDEGSIVALELQPGEMSIHHALVLHGSAPNRSGWPRIGFAMRYIAADNAQADGTRGTATLVAGQERGGYDLEIAPEALMHPAAMRRHAHVLRQGQRIIYGN